MEKRLPAQRISLWRPAVALALAGAISAASAGSAGAVRLPGPKGVVPARTPASSVFGAPRGARVLHARSSHVLRAQGSRVLHARGAAPTKAIARVEYQGGPVMHTSRIYTIFWQPSPLPQGVAPFSSGYEKTVNTYFQDLAGDSGKTSNFYSIATQYYAGAPGSESHIEYSTSLAATDTATNSFPSSECTDAEVEETPLPVCLTENQLEQEIESVIEARHWTAGPESIFFIYTPAEIGGCFTTGGESKTNPEANQCAYSYYCAYHDDFSDPQLPASGDANEVVFADMPYEATPACDDGARPEGSDAGPAIDAGSHEHMEAVTDPTGEGWFDSAGSEETNADFGEEMADLCVLQTPALTYGPLLGGGAYETAGAFNQAISGADYLLQRDWSDAANSTGGACVQRMAPAVFTAPTAAQATRPASFDGTASGTPEYPVLSWSWDFGDGSSGSGASVSHTYASPGAYTVTLTVTDAYEDSNTTSRSVSVGQAPHEEPPREEHPPTTTTSEQPPTEHPPTITTTAPAQVLTVATSPAFASLSGAELAAALGLPHSGAPLAASTGTVVLGHAACPLACSLEVDLYVTVPTSRHGHRATRRELVGSARIAASGAGEPIAIKLNAYGRALLRREHRLAVQLTISVSDQQGLTRQLSDSLTLTAPERATRHRH